MPALLLCFCDLNLQRMQHLPSCPWQCLTAGYLASHYVDVKRCSLFFSFPLTASWLGQQDAVQAKGRASAALQQAQQQQVQSSEHLALLSKQLAEARQQEAALSVDVDNLQTELARYKTQVRHSHNVCRQCCDETRRQYWTRRIPTPVQLVDDALL